MKVIELYDVPIPYVEPTNLEFVNLLVIVGFAMIMLYLNKNR
jgi:hypothetical protein